ncbi:MAG: NlpC/P60 family protein [Ginsengibacter sp.]
MKKLTAIFALLLLAGTVFKTNAQTSVNTIRITPESTYPEFIEGISFTPEGILQNTETAKMKSQFIASSEAGVAAKKIESDLNNLDIENVSGTQFKYAMLMDVNVESLRNLSLFTFIEKWMGVRYRLGGTTKRGIDCSALTGTLLMAVYGFAVPRTAREQYKASTHIEKEFLQEGDLVFFNTHGGVSHVGLYLENNYFLHASSSQGVTISNLEDPYYVKRFISGGRIEID